MGVDLRGDEALPGETEDDEGIVAERDRAEHARLAVAPRLEGLRGDLVAKNVRCARVVRAAVQIPPVRRENEVRRDGGPEVELGHGGGLPLEEILDLHHAQRVVAAHVPHGGGQHLPVGGDVHVVDHLSVGE